MGGAWVYHREFHRHGGSEHPFERPERLVVVQEAIRASGLESRLTPLEPRYATSQEIERVHPLRHLRSLENFCAQGGGWLDDDTLLSPDSARVALLAAGGGLRAVEAVLDEGLPWAFVLSRPPGHHAGRTESLGFCLLNNVALAARHAQVYLGLKRILIVDWDVHHGNGTQDIFYDDPSVLVFSVHQDGLFPADSGGWEEQGHGAGRGTTINVPLPSHMGDAEYRLVFDEVLAPAAAWFDPELVLVSAGFDAHEWDRVSGMRLTSEGFGHLAAQVMRVAQTTSARGRVVGILEGGYDLAGLAGSCLAVLRAWGEGRDAPPSSLEGAPRELREIVERARDWQDS